MGGGNCLFGTETPPSLFRGCKSIVEVASETTNPTKLPDTGLLQAGTVDTNPRCFDLLCFGKCAPGDDIKLDIQSTGEPPNLITKNANGDIVFAEPKPMCTIRAPRGHNVWVNIELKTVTTKISSYMCLGIKKRSEDEYFYIIRTGDSSRYVDVQEDDVVELIPLVSSTPLSTGYTAVKSGDSVEFTEETTYDFGSIYRVDITLDKNQWVENQSCDLHKIWSETGWNNDGAIGTGSVADEYGHIHDDQLLAININGKFARSSDGIHWYEAGSLIQEGESEGKNNEWYYHVTHGNGIWCAISVANGVRRSIDYGRTWYSTSTIKSQSLAFGNGTFMTITEDGAVYVSSDAEIWTQIGTVESCSDGGRLLFYDKDRWIYGTLDGRLYWSRSGVGEWKYLSDGLKSVKAGIWRGACYTNEDFYALCGGGPVAKSSNGIEWNPIIGLKQGYNITYYKNKLFMFNPEGTLCHVGLINPDGSI